MAMTGMFVGMGKAFTAVIDRSPADIMVISAQSENLNDNPGMPRRLKPSIYMHPEVVAVDERQTGWGRFQNQPGPGGKPKSSGVHVMTLDTVPGSVPIPSDFDDSVRIALEEPYAIAVVKLLKVEPISNVPFDMRFIQPSLAPSAGVLGS